MSGSRIPPQEGALPAGRSLKEIRERAEYHQATWAPALAPGMADALAKDCLWLVGVVEELEAREASLRDALTFYADEANWTQPASWGGRIFDDESVAISDLGSRARRALSPGVVDGKE